MSEEDRLKSAFSKVKRDVVSLKKDLEDLKSKQKETLSKEDMDRFTTSLDQVKSLVDENNKRITVIRNCYEDPSDNVDKKLNSYKEEFDELERRNFEINSKLDTVAKELRQLVETRTQQLKESIEKKNEELVSRVEEMENGLKNIVYRDEVEEKFTGINDSLQDKLNTEINTLRYEFMEEITKLYDLIGEDDGGVKKISGSVNRLKDSYQDYKSDNLEKLDSGSSSRKSPIKKVADWFLEDDEEELNSVKKEIKR